MTNSNLPNSNYTIRTVQQYPEHLFYALFDMKNSQDNYLYTNCRSYLRVGERKIPVQFDTALVSEESESIILLKKGVVSLEELQSTLDCCHIPFHEIHFMKTCPLLQTDTKEICFVRDEDELRTAIADSRKKGIDVCSYYPALSGKFELRQPIDYEKTMPFIRQLIRGAIVLEDKIVLLTSASKEMNITYKDALSELDRQNMIVIIYKEERTIPQAGTAKQFRKEQ